MEDDKFDGVLMNIVQQSSGINGFFEAFFGFLRRKTDYFSNPQDAKELLMKNFEAHKTIYEENKRVEELNRKKKEEDRKRKEELKNQKVVEVTDEEAQKIQEEAKKPQTEETKEVKKQEGEEEEEEEGAIPVNNGGATDRYVWTQTLGEITINFFIPQEATGRQIKVNVTPNNIKVLFKGEVLVEGEFEKRIKPDEMVWTIDTLEGKKVLSFTVDKYEGMNWWKCALKGDPIINTKKIEPENSKLGDLDGETRNTVEKMMIDQQRKAAGKPTLEEESKQEMLKKFMDAHPEMDFSKAKFS